MSNVICFATARRQRGLTTPTQDAQAALEAEEQEAQRLREQEQAELDALLDAALGPAPAVPTVSKQGKRVEYRNIQGKSYTQYGVKKAGPIDEGHHADIVKGKSIRIFGTETNRVDGPVDYDQTFAVGDRAEHGSYNLRYIGTIVSIGEKTVTIEDMGKRKRLSIYEFSWRNRVKTVAEKQAQNSEDMMYL